MSRLLTTIIFCFSISCAPSRKEIKNWPVYLADNSSSQYADLDQINTENIHDLKLAWTYDAGDRDPKNRTQIQCNPLIIDGILYGTNPKLKLFALDAKSGKELWKFDPWNDKYDQFGANVNRGVSYWSNGIKERILFSAGQHLYSIDAKTGAQDLEFGNEGMVSLHKGLGNYNKDFFISSNTPGIVFKDLLIMGSRVSESTGAAPGHIRAFHIETGEIAWIFHTIPKPDEAGYDTWPEDAYKKMGGANAWAGFSLDEEREIVFAPTGSASFDFYGGDREGANLYANCILALDANNGKLIWHYQTVHHDVWDRDLPSPPNLISIKKDGKQIDAIAQSTKSGFIFILDRETGEALYPIEEVPVPQNGLKEEKLWPTQPVPSTPKPFARVTLQENEITNISDSSHQFVAMSWPNLNKGQQYIPFTEKGTILFPGFDGGAEWGGQAFDPKTKTLYINSNETPWVVQMLPYKKKQGKELAVYGQSLYQTACITCHGKDLKGASIHTIPSLENLKSRMSLKEVVQVIKNGQGAMPSFAFLNDASIEAISAYLTDSKMKANKEQIASLQDSQNDDWPYPYTMTGYIKYRDQLGYPAITPPWGTLHAIDMNTHEYKWSIPFGSYPELVDKGITNTGSENYGGPVVSSGGLLFIGATLDEKFRVFDKETGEVLWEYQLDAAAYATPSTYMVDGKQYVVIAAGGGKLGTKSGSNYYAFSL